MKTLTFYFFILLSFSILSIEKIKSQTYNDFIGISVNVTPDAMAALGFTNNNEFIADFNSKLSALNNEFSNIDVEFYATYYFITDPSDIQGPLNTIRIRVDCGSNLSSGGLRQSVIDGNDLSRPININFNFDAGNKTIIHEFAHTFGLPHSFKEYTDHDELVTRPFQEGTRLLSADCDYNGDGFCDTQAQSYSAMYDANNDNYFQVDNNYMNYSVQITLPDDSRYFSTEQYERMRFELETNGYTNDFIDYGHTTERLKADFNFTHDNYNYNTQNAITFTNLSTHKTGGTQISDWAIFYWDFGDGSTTVVTNSYNPQTHTYTTPGTYKVKLTCKWQDNSDGGAPHYNNREKYIRIQNLIDAPYLNTFETESDLEDFFIENTFKMRKYYGFNNYSASIESDEFNEGSMSFCIDATSITNQILSFDVNHNKYCRISDTYDNSQPLNLYINDVLITSYTFPYSDSWNKIFIDLSDYAGQVANIKLSTPDGTYLFDNLKLEVFTPLSVNIIQNPNCNGQATATPQGGYPPYNFLWSGTPTQTNATAINLTAGNHAVTVTDSYGNTATASVNVSGTTVTPPAINITINDITCYGKHNGSLQALVSSGVSPYQYHWSNNYPLPNNPNLYPSTYYLTVTDDNSCMSFASATIAEPAPITLSSVSKTNVCLNECNGTATLNFSGGTSPYTYEWSDGQTTQTADNLCQGLYTFTVYDSNNCLFNHAMFVNIQTSPQPVITTIVNDVSCYGYNDGSIDLSVSGGTAPFTYLWSNGQSTEDLFNIHAGSYFVTITDANQCTTTANVGIIHPHEFILLPHTFVKDVSCYGGSDGIINLNGETGGTPPYSYLWSNGYVTEDADMLQAGIYTLTITDSHQCQLITDFSITEPSQIVLSGSSTDVSCTGSPDGTATVNISGGVPPYTYSWNTGQYTQTVTGIQQGDYQVIVTDFHNCYNEITVHVSTDPALTFIPPSGLNITSDILWNDNYIIDGKVEVQNGGKLTIQNSTIQFTPNSEIIVREGGKLIVENSTLTKFNTCGDIWCGITAYGYPDISQNGDPTLSGYPHAFVHIKGSTIEYTGTAIYAGDPLLRDTRRGAGAVVWVEDYNTTKRSIFNNNYKCIVFKGYGASNSSTNFANKSYIKNSDFLCDNQLPSLIDPAFGSEGTSDFILFMGANNINFTNLYFENTGSFTNKGKGITTILPFQKGSITSCTFRNILYGFKGLINEVDITSCTFENLEQGLHIEQVSGMSNNNYTSNTFTNVKEAFYLQATKMDNISDNIFNIPYSATDDVYGIFSVGNISAYILNNTFNGASTANDNSYGIVSDNAAISSNVIFNNTFSGLNIGIQTQNDNSKLKIRCNNFSNIGSHGIKVQDGSLKQQGADCNSNAGNTNQAGNEWLDGYTTGEKDIYVPDDISFIYKAHERNADMDFYTQANSSSQLWKTSDREVCDGVYKTSTSCTSYAPGLPPPPPVTSYSDYVVAINSLMVTVSGNIQNIRQKIETLKAITDGGNTNYLISRINQNIPAGLLKNELLTKLPLSDEVMLTAVNRSNPLPAGILKEILIPNAPLSRKLFRAVGERIPRLPKGIINEIIIAQQNDSQYPKFDALYSELNYWNVELDLLRNELIRLKLKNGQKPEAIEILKNAADVEAKKQLAEIYLGDGELELSRAMLDTIMQDTASLIESAEYTKLLNELITVKENNITIQEIDALTEQKVREVAESQTFISANAEAVLNHTGKGNYKHHIHKGNNARSIAIDASNEENNYITEFPKEEYLDIYPNPSTTGKLTIDYNFTDNTDKDFIISDITGKVIYKSILIGKNNNSIINNLKISSGIYYYKVLSKNENSFFGKIIIIN